MLQYIRLWFWPVTVQDHAHRELQRCELERLRAQALLDYYICQTQYYDTRINRLKEVIKQQTA